MVQGHGTTEKGTQCFQRKPSTFLFKIGENLIKVVEVSEKVDEEASD